MAQRFGTPTSLAGEVDERPRDPMLVHAEAIAAAAAQLRPLSHSAAQLITMNAADDVSSADVVQLVSHDQVLAAAVLREANSAASGATSGITAIDQAVVRLGMQRVLSLSIRLSLSDELHEAVPEYGMTDGELGLLSVVGSIAAEVVRERATVRLPAEVNTAALLRDIGLLVLARFLDTPHRLLLDVVRDTGSDLPAGERMVLDANHGEAGGLLCQQWRLPETVRLGVQYHHDPVACDEPIAHGVFLADVLAHLVCERTGGRWSHSAPDPDVMAESAVAIGLDLSSVDTLVDTVITRFEMRDTGLSLHAPS